MKFLEYWNKFVDFVKKYWQLLLGFLIGILVIVKLRPPKTSISEALDVLTDAGKKEAKAEQTFDQNVENTVKTADENHEHRVENIQRTEEAEVKKANEDLDVRITENKADTVDNLANKIANDWGVNVVRPEK